MSPAAAYILLALLWVAASIGGGALLALLAKRLHPDLSFRRLWIFYSILLGAATAVLFAIGIF